MKVYTITDRHLREFAQVIGEEARRPLLEFIRNLMREMQAAAGEMAELRKELAPIIRGNGRLAMQARYISRVDGGGCCGTLATRW